MRGDLGEGNIEFFLGSRDLCFEPGDHLIDTGPGRLEQFDLPEEFFGLLHRLQHIVLDGTLTGPEASDLGLQSFEILDGRDLPAVEAGVAGIGFVADDLGLVLEAALSRRHLYSGGGDRIDLDLLSALLGLRIDERPALIQMGSAIRQLLRPGVEVLEVE